MTKQPVALGQADLTVSDGTTTYGYSIMGQIQEQRGVSFAGQVSSGAPTYRDQKPLNIAAFESFSGGFGQESLNKVTGGSGSGGDASRYLDGNAWTLKGQRLLPSMRRRQYAPYGALKETTYNNDIPSGIIPCYHPAGAYANFSIGSNYTGGFARLRLLVRVEQLPPTTYYISLTATVTNYLATKSWAFTAVLGTTTIKLLNGYAWVTFYGSVKNSTGDIISAGTYFVNTAKTNDVSFGGYIGAANVLQPYVQWLGQDGCSDNFQVAGAATTDSGATITSVSGTWARTVSSNGGTLTCTTDTNAQICTMDYGAAHSNCVFRAEVSGSSDVTDYRLFRLLFRYTSATAYLYAQVHYNNIQLVKVAGGITTVLVSVLLPEGLSGLPRGSATYNIEVRNWRQYIQVSVGGQQLISYKLSSADWTTYGAYQKFGFQLAKIGAPSESASISSFSYSTINGSYAFGSLPRKVEVISDVANTTTKYAIAVTETGIQRVNSGASETTWGGTNDSYLCSVVFDNALYVATTADKVYQWSATAAYNSAAATTNGAASFASMCVHAGKIFGASPTSGIYKWDGTYPIPLLTAIINPNSIGKKSTNGANPINKIVMYRGFMYVLKPEGLFGINADINSVVSTTLPDVQYVVNLEQQGQEWVHNGKFCVEFNGSLVFNVKDKVYVFTNNGASGNQVTVLVAPFPRENVNSNHFVTGIATDGQVLYISYQNTRVVAYNGTGWHPVAELHDQILEDFSPSGLSYAQAQIGAGMDSQLFFADGRSLCSVGVPQFDKPYTHQFYRSEQAQCGYLITSAWDADLAAIKKWLYSVSMYGNPAGYYYKIVGSIRQTAARVASWSKYVPPGASPPPPTTLYLSEDGAQTRLERTFVEGLWYDKWQNATVPATNITPAVVDAPCYFEPTDFLNEYDSTEQEVSADHLSSPINVATANFIIYYWHPNLYNGTYDTSEMSSIESVLLNYMPVQDYLPYYRMTISFANSMDINSDTAELYSTVAFFRSRINAKTLTRFRFTSPDGTATSVLGFIHEHVFMSDGISIADGDPVPAYVTFYIIVVKVES
jgi:hypothetical protein